VKNLRVVNCAALSCVSRVNLRLPRIEAINTKYAKFCPYFVKCERLMLISQTDIILNHNNLGSYADYPCRYFHPRLRSYRI
jgi:hypothetical protein